MSFLAQGCYDLGMQDVLKVDIPASTVSQDPIRLDGSAAVIQVTVGKNARVSILHDLRQGESHTVEMIVGDGAHVEFVTINRFASNVPVSIRQRSRVGENATIQWKNVTLGGSTVEHDLQSELTGAHAVSAIDWMFYAKGEEKYRLSARNIFNGRDGGGEITIKGVAEGKAHARCDGMIEIGSGGAGTHTYLTENILMLDATAKVDAIPGLEIKTNDVKASHSASITRVTDDDLFYFAARGIIEKEAKRMFVEGFLREMVSRISDGKVQAEVLASVEGKYCGDT